MADPSDVLDRLRPLRPPPSDGTIDILVMAFAGCVVAAALVMAFHLLRDRRRPLRRAALGSLAASRTLPPPDRLAAQAQLLREVAGALDPHARAMRGDAWLARLDAIFSTTFFREGPGRAFGDALYQPLADIPAEALDGALARLLERLEK